MKKIGIIGGGAAGLAAAIAAARAGTEAGQEIAVTVLERMETAGRKILATGNGHCNFTNMKMTAECYHTDDPRRLQQLLQDYPPEWTIRFFASLGIQPLIKDGYVYPRSNQAAAVVSALLRECRRLGVKIRLNTAVQTISRRGSGFAAVTDSGYAYEFDRLILTAGGRTQPALGSDGSGYALAQMLGHSCLPVFPALTALIPKQPVLRGAAGVRTDAKAAALIDGAAAGSAAGELQITEKAVSGILIFQISYQISKALSQGRKTAVRLDLLPDYTEEQILALLRTARREQSWLTTAEFLGGLLPAKLCHCLLNIAGIDEALSAGRLNDLQTEVLTHTIKQLQIEIGGTAGYTQAQVSGGGILLAETDRQLRSRITPDLFLAGELLNVTGLCGGYNLHWAWLSGYAAGTAAAAE